MLDLKKENNYNKHNITQADTIPFWKEFLNNVSKSEITKYKVLIRNIDTYKKWILPIMSSYCIIMHLHNGRDFQLTL